MGTKVVKEGIKKPLGREKFIYRRIDMGAATEEKLENYGKEQEAPQETVQGAAQEPEIEETPEAKSEDLQEVKRLVIGLFSTNGRDKCEEIISRDLVLASGGYDFKKYLAGLIPSEDVVNG
jgi:hypothetical protein